MIILHIATPSSFLKAAMLSRLHRGTCIHKDELATTLLAGCLDETIDCDSLSLQTVLGRYESAFGPLVWLGSTQSRQLSSAAFYAARYNAKDRYQLIFTVIGQALERGPNFVLSRVSREARNMFNRARRVCVEIQRAYGFVRLIPVDGVSGPIMVGRAEFENDIADIVVRYFTRRHPKQAVYLIVGNSAYHFENGAMAITDVFSLPFSLPEDGFTELWEAYYDSQSIEGRRNPELARKHLPKKYWSWVPEGKKLK
ncbi:MAG: DUF4130 domain-containing protein [Eubacteriales bacterium]|nr:DUF4130 domain-containing protein [Bacillota bacterium]